MMRFLLLSIFLVFSLAAEEKPLLERERFNAVFENDAFFRIDRWYSVGVDLSLLYKFNDDSFHLPFLDHKNSISYLGFGLSLEMYTPASLSDPFPQPNDRPYAGWLYGSFAFHQSNAKRLDSLELQVGVVGPSSKAQQVQAVIHDHILGDDVKGWRYQLHDELGVNLAYHHHERYPISLKKYESVFIPRIGGVLGDVRTEFDVGALYRVGVNIPKDYGQNFVMMPGLDSTIPAVDKGIERNKNHQGYYLQVQSDVRFVIRDMFLQGNTDGNSLSVNPYPLVFRLGGGIGGSYENYQLSLIYTVESKSFTQQSKIHAYASLLFTYSF